MDGCPGARKVGGSANWVRPLASGSSFAGHIYPGPPTCPAFAEAPLLTLTSPGIVTCCQKPRPRADLMAPPLTVTPCSKAYPPPSDRRATASCGGGRSCCCGRSGCRGVGESPRLLETASQGASPRSKAGRLRPPGGGGMTSDRGAPSPRLRRLRGACRALWSPRPAERASGAQTDYISQRPLGGRGAACAQSPAGLRVLSSQRLDPGLFWRSLGLGRPASRGKGSPGAAQRELMRSRAALGVLTSHRRWVGRLPAGLWFQLRQARAGAGARCPGGCRPAPRGPTRSSPLAHPQ